MSSTCKIIPLNQDPSPFLKIPLYIPSKTPQSITQKKYTKSPSVDVKEKRKVAYKVSYNLGEDIYNVFPTKAEKKQKDNSNWIKELKFLLSTQKCGNQDLENWFESLADFNHH